MVTICLGHQSYYGSTVPIFAVFHRKEWKRPFMTCGCGWAVGLLMFLFFLCVCVFIPCPPPSIPSVGVQCCGEVHFWLQFSCLLSYSNAVCPKIPSFPSSSPASPLSWLWEGKPHIKLIFMLSEGLRLSYNNFIFEVSVFKKELTYHNEKWETFWLCNIPYIQSRKPYFLTEQLFQSLINHTVGIPGTFAYLYLV